MYLSLLLIVAGVLGAACAGDQSVLAPVSEQSGRIARLWWVMFWLGVAVYLVVMGLLLFALFRRRGDDGERGGGRWDSGLVLGGGIALPAVVIAVLFLLTLSDMSVLGRSASSDALRIEVTGHQFWWEVRYPDLGVVTANEIYVPTDRPVVLRLTSKDVIHSFWVPRLHGKVDLNPGSTNELIFTADAPGTYRGQCAEFCGIQHAFMRMLVVAQDEAAFQLWAREQREPAPRPLTEQTIKGEQVFLGSACVYCHAVQGTAASGRIGPDLTHIASRRTLGAGTVTNNRGNLAGWILNPQSIKPGNKMPPTSLSGPELQALLDYVETLE